MAAMLSVALALAMQAPAGLTDAQLVAHGGGDFLLRARVENALYGDPAIERELLRVGLDRSCVIADAIQHRAVEANRAAFDVSLAAAMRTVVPAHAWTPHASIHRAPMEFYRSRIDREIERTGGGVYVAAVRQASAELITRLAGMSSVVPAEAAGGFADWRLETPLAVKIACHLTAAARGDRERLRQMKLPFDTFYHRRGT